MRADINKRDLWRYVNLKIKRAIHHYHIFAVMSILFEEMIKDFKDGKTIKICNFGTFCLKKMAPRRFFNIGTQKIAISKGNKIIRISLSHKLRKKLYEHLDLDSLEKKCYDE